MNILMKASGIAAAIGFFLIICVAGNIDYYMELGVDHAVNYVQIIVGLVMMMQYPAMLALRERIHR